MVISGAVCDRRRDPQWRSGGCFTKACSDTFGVFNSITSGWRLKEPWFLSTGFCDWVRDGGGYRFLPSFTLRAIHRTRAPVRAEGSQKKARPMIGHVICTTGFKPSKVRVVW